MMHELCPLPQVNTQSSIRLPCAGKTVYADPFRIAGQPADADYVFLTHDHYDHFSPADLAAVIRPETVIVAPRRLAENPALRAFGNEILAVAPGETLALDGFAVEMVPAYNRNKPFHPKENGWVGYVFCAGGKRIYVAGDTDRTPEAEAVACDLALLPIGGTYTMDAAQAAGLANWLRPAAVIPTHYGSIVGSPGDFDVFAAAVDPAIRVVKAL